MCVPEIDFEYALRGRPGQRPFDGTLERARADWRELERLSSPLRPRFSPSLGRFWDSLRRGALRSRGRPGDYSLR